MTDIRKIIKEELNKLLMESSKLDILIKKEGLNPEEANILNDLCGPLSIWMLNKIKALFHNTDSNEKIDLINQNKYIDMKKNLIKSIMDWIKYGLNGNVNPYKDLPFEELYDLSLEWSKSVKLEIDYIEKNAIILDFRNTEGFGFYWADLGTKRSEEECERMDHCGTSKNGYLYSLRNNKPHGKEHTVNKSVLTASIGLNGTLYQLKGKKNSKPKEEYYKYILPLFYVKIAGEYLITDIGSEYDSANDFKISDLPEPMVNKLMVDRPELF